MPIANVITHDCDHELKKNIKSKIAYLSDDIINIKEIGGNLEIEYLDKNNGNLQGLINQVSEEEKRKYREYDNDILFQHRAQTPYPEQNIYDELVKAGWVVPYDNGLIGFGKGFLNLFKYFDNIFSEWAGEYNAEEYNYPDLLKIETVNKYQYISQFPQHILFASHLRKDLGKIEQVSRDILDNTDCLNDKNLSNPRYINKTAVCTHVYEQFAEQEIDLDKPIVITSIGKCKRYESLNMRTAERLLDFNMREIVFIGAAEYVQQCRDELMRKVEQLITALDISATIITGNDPFFTNQYYPKMFMQRKFKRKFELNFFLPGENIELAVGSFNFHGTYFTDAFNIHSPCGEFVHTGCVAFGLERFIYAYLCQKGLVAPPR